MYKLDGKVVIVTGAGRKNGIGEAIINRFAEENCRLVITDNGTNNETNKFEESTEIAKVLDLLSDQLNNKGVEFIYIPCDVRDEVQIENLVLKTVEHFGRLDVFINNAGIGYVMQLITEITPEQWDSVMEINLKTYYLGIKHAGLQMIKQYNKSGTPGRIINIGSQASKSGFPYGTAYSASKHGVLGLTRSAAIELAKYSITVNVICPNHITTSIEARQNEFFSMQIGKQNDQFLEDIRRRVPLGRTGLTTDTSNIAAFLASSEASYITGEAINVSGGEEMH